MMKDATEAFCNAAVGLLVSWAATFYVLPPLFGIHPSAAQSAGITALFFGLSFARSWAIRATFRRLG
jgi:hypothetical protein